MNTKLLALTCVVLVLVPFAALGQVTGSDHDTTGGTGEVCASCHIPHNAGTGSELWWTTPSATFGNQADLCFTCHNGDVTTLGQTTAFNSSLEQHKDVGTGCSSTLGCHDVHDQNGAGGVGPSVGKFLQVNLTGGSYCTTCHGSAIPTDYQTAGNTHGDHTAGSQHELGGGTGGTLTCNGCHTAHGAVAQTDVTLLGDGNLTNAILLADNTSGGYYGAFCISCHDGTAPTGGTGGSGGVRATDTFDYAEAVADLSEFKHPTTTTATTIPVGGCNKCHDVHDSVGTDFGYILMADNTNSAYCVSCHDGAAGPAVGTNTHYVGDTFATANHGDMSGANSGATPALPWANQIDEDAATLNTIDWASATANEMVCESCHSVHRQGVGSPFLRQDNSTSGLCKVCHSTN